MAVQYSLTARKNLQNPEAAPKYYATAKSRGKLSVRQISKEIAERSTVNSIDVVAVLEAFLQIVPEKLLDGYIVKLGDFGTFSVSLNSKGVENEDDFDKSLIEKINVKFRAGKEVRSSLLLVDYEKID